MVNPEKACHELLSEIAQKTFNSKGSAVLKRYYSIFLARGGKESSQCTFWKVGARRPRQHHKEEKEKGTRRHTNTDDC
jgi:hypothetical protein